MIVLHMKWYCRGKTTVVPFRRGTGGEAGLLLLELVIA